MAETAAVKRNIVWVFGDQHRSQALGCHGDPNLHTPNIDRMAQLGLDFPAPLPVFRSAVRSADRC